MWFSLLYPNVVDFKICETALAFHKPFSIHVCEGFLTRETANEKSCVAFYDLRNHCEHIVLFIGVFMHTTHAIHTWIKPGTLDL